jgi:uncharacterized membrane protein YoaK (UPF0700 family)
MPVAYRTSQSFGLAVLLSFTSGSIEAYSVLKLGAFAGAQSGNLVLAATQIARWHWRAAAPHLWPLLAFTVGVIMAQTLLTPRVVRVVRRPYRAILTFELIMLVAMGFLPDSTPRVIASVIITIAVSAQMSTFRTVVDIGYNSAFTTGNLMNAITAAHAGIVKHDREQLVHARRGLGIIASYLAGAILGGVCAYHLGRHGIWISAALLAVALGLFVSDERLERQAVLE